MTDHEIAQRSNREPARDFRRRLAKREAIGWILMGLFVLASLLPYLFRK